jgi:phage terminase small subunit
MSDRLTLKQENFIAAYLANGGNATDAYRQAYDCSAMTDKSINENASKLLRNAKVAPRLQVLQEQAATKAVLNRAWVLERLMRNADAAKAANDYTASNKALELLGKVDELSMFVERSNVQSDNRHHLKVDAVSTFDGFLAEASGGRAKVDPEEPVPN